MQISVFVIFKLQGIWPGKVEVKDQFWSSNSALTHLVLQYCLPGTSFLGSSTEHELYHQPLGCRRLNLVPSASKKNTTSCSTTNLHSLIAELQNCTAEVQIQPQSIKPMQNVNGIISGCPTIS